MTTKIRHIQQYRIPNQARRNELDRQRLTKYQPQFPQKPYIQKPKDDR